ncbi:hypothetical protein [Geminisphaera colitermitum]|uniref:hypothetical protein n=1 Tax=Geminisphaera colitermitum TaxID=1148786 RepID=UPI0005BC3801|nr:hypothetical protein [Geminisphaera colitermitum]
MTEARRQQLLHAIVDVWDRQFDPSTGLLPPPATLSCNLHYAFALLETAERPRMGRAEALISRITHAILLPPPPPSATGFPLALIWHRHRMRLVPALQELISSTLQHFASTLRQRSSRDLDALDVFVMLSVAEFTFDSVMLAQALDQFDQLGRLIAAPASPLTSDGTRTRHAHIAAGDHWTPILIALHLMENHVRHPAVLERIEALHNSAWKQLRSLPPDNAGLHEFRSAKLATLIERITSTSSAHHDDSVPCVNDDLAGVLQVLVLNIGMPRATTAMLTAA